MEVLVMLLQKINAFTLHTMKMLMMRANKETKSHFDFGLFGNLNGSEYIVKRVKSLRLHITEKI